jgi:hypothetical protein
MATRRLQRRRRLTAAPNWQTGDTLIASGNVRYRVVSVIPAEKVAEFVDGPNVGIIEVEPLSYPGRDAESFP